MAQALGAGFKNFHSPVCVAFYVPCDLSDFCFYIGEKDNNLIAVVQLFSHVRLFVTPWTVACQASLCLIISWSLLKFMFIASVMLSSHFIL